MNIAKIIEYLVLILMGYVVMYMCYMIWFDFDNPSTIRLGVIGGVVFLIEHITEEMLRRYRSLRRQR